MSSSRQAQLTKCSALAQYPDFVPYCTMQESYSGTVPKTVVGSKAYW